MTVDDVKSHAYCTVCFDVRKEDKDVESGTTGVGACSYFDSNGAGPYNNPNYFGVVEAQGSDSFKFLPKEENDWMYDDTGFIDWEPSFAYTSNFDGSASMSINLWSKPQNYNNRNKLGIKQSKTYLKCYAGYDDAPAADGVDHEFSLENFSTDKARRIDLRWLDASASAWTLFTTILVLIVS